MPEVAKIDNLIIGGGIAGIAAAEAIRDAENASTIHIINGESDPPYCRPLIIELLTGERTFDEINLRDAAWFSNRNISVGNGDKAITIDTGQKLVTCESATRFEYDKLLIATGSIPPIPPIPGLEDVPYNSLFSHADASALKKLAKPGRKALVLGIGLIGLQAMTALRKLVVEVIAVEMLDRVLPLILDLRAAEYARKRMESNGIDVRIGGAVTKLAKTDDGTHPYKAIVDGQDDVEFDLLVLATGMKPDLSLVEGTDIGHNRGIKVSESMETNIDGVYAAGDIVEYNNWILGRDEIHAHWVNAFRQGRIAGLSMVGVDAPEYDPMFLNSLDVFGLPLITMGSSRDDHPEDAEVFVSEVPSREAYTRFVVRKGQLISATFINDVDRAGILQYLMREKIDLGENVRSLFEDGKHALEFLYQLHNDVIRGDLEWPETMDLIDHYRKDVKRTRWGDKK